MVAVNAEKEIKKLEVELPMLAGQEVSYYSDNKDRSPKFESVKVSKNSKFKLTLQPEGGAIMTTAK